MSLRQLTPRLRAEAGVGDKRVRLLVSPEDARKVKRGEAWEAEVTDVPSGATYKLMGASCGLTGGCLCDAIVISWR